MIDVLITIDTELSAGLHQRGFTPAQNVASSIEGRVGEHRFGVDWQMDEMDAAGLKGVFFVDPLPALVYGSDILPEILAPILRRGHEVQLHIHTEWLQWASQSPVGDRRGRNIGDFSVDDQVTLLAIAAKLLEQAGTPRPIAFRAGNFGADDRTIAALSRLGILWDSSVNPGAPDGSCRIRSGGTGYAPYRLGGVVELPIAGLYDRPGHYRPAQVCALSSWEMRAALRHAASGDDPFTIVTHSFEMLSRDRLRPNRTVIDRFKRMCGEIASHPGLRSAGFRDLDPAIAAEAETAPVIAVESCEDLGANGRTGRRDRAVRTARGLTHMSRIGIETDRDTRTLPIRFQIAERSVWVARRRVRHIGFSLADLLAGRLPHVPDLAPREDGIDLRSIPDAAATALCHDGEGLPGLVRQRYPRHFLRLTGTFEHYLQGFSAKSRSTLKRKRKRWTEASAGLDVRDYHDADRIGEFIDLAGALSRRTYQERLLGAGLPLDPESVAEMRHRATHAALRAHILFHRGQPAAYLYLPIEDGTLIYAHLGHEPGLADLSPGTVLQFEVLERLFPDPTLTLFDFTEGDGAHKRLFGREHIDCADVLLLRPTLRNRLLLAGLAGFDGSIAWIGRKTEASGIKPALKRMLRG